MSLSSMYLPGIGISHLFYNYMDNLELLMLSLGSINSRRFSELTAEEAGTISFILGLQISVWIKGRPVSFACQGNIEHFLSRPHVSGSFSGNWREVGVSSSINICSLHQPIEKRVLIFLQQCLFSPCLI